MRPQIDVYYVPTLNKGPTVEHVLSEQHERQYCREARLKGFQGRIASRRYLNDNFVCFQRIRAKFGGYLLQLNLSRELVY